MQGWIGQDKLLLADVPFFNSAPDVTVVRSGFGLRKEHTRVPAIPPPLALLLLFLTVWPEGQTV